MSVEVVNGLAVDEACGVQWGLGRLSWNRKTGVEAEVTVDLKKGQVPLLGLLAVKLMGFENWVPEIVFETRSRGN